MKWEFSSGNYIKVYNDDGKVAWFDYDYSKHSKIRIAWTVGVFTPADWDEALACVKEAKKILKRIRRIR